MQLLETDSLAKLTNAFMFQICFYYPSVIVMNTYGPLGILLVFYVFLFNSIDPFGKWDTTKIVIDQIGWNTSIDA